VEFVAEKGIAGRDGREFKVVIVNLFATSDVLVISLGFSVHLQCYCGYLHQTLTAYPTVL